MIIYPQAIETTLASATNVQNSSYVSVLNAGATATLTIRAVPDNIGDRRTITVLANERITIRKEPTDTLEGGADFKAVPVLRQQ